MRIANFPTKLTYVRNSFLLFVPGQPKNLALKYKGRNGECKMQSKQSINIVIRGGGGGVRAGGLTSLEYITRFLYDIRIRNIFSLKIRLKIKFSTRADFMKF